LTVPYTWPTPGTSSQMFADNYTPNANLANQLTYMGLVYQALASTNNTDAIGAVQLAIWALIDQKPPGTNGFSFSTSDSTLTTDFNAIVAALGGTTSTSGGYTSASGIGGSTSGSGSNYVDGVKLANYSTQNVYSGATLIMSAGDFDSGRTQNLITWGTVTYTQSVTP